MCYHAQFGRSSLKNVVIDENTRNWGSAMAPHLWDGAVADPQNTSPYQYVLHHVKFGSFASKGGRRNRKEPHKLGSAGVPPRCGGGVVDP